MTKPKPEKPPSTAEPPATTAPPKKGRKPLMADAKDKRIAVRLTASDHDQIDAAARAAGLTVGAYMRKTALGTSGKRAKRRPTHQHEALARLLAEAGKIGSNVNQIAKWSNTEKLSPVLTTVRAMERDLALLRSSLMEALGHDH